MRFPEVIKFHPYFYMATRSRRRVVPTCAVNCELEDETSPLYPCCNDHRIHLCCLNKLFETTDEPSCPVCRDPFLKIVKDLCIKNPHVDSEEEEEDPVYEEEEDEEDGSVDLCPATEENRYLRRLVRELSAQYVRDYDSAESGDVVLQMRLTRSPPSLSPPRLRPRPGPFP